MSAQSDCPLFNVLTPLATERSVSTDWDFIDNLGPLYICM